MYGYRQYFRIDTQQEHKGLQAGFLRHDELQRCIKPASVGHPAALDAEPAGGLWVYSTLTVIILKLDPLKYLYIVYTLLTNTKYSGIILL